MNNLTLKQFRYFEALARMGHFGRAAEVCAISQPALSMQIKEIESQVGLLLFDREGRRLSLSTAGEYFLVHAKRLLANLKEAVTGQMMRIEVQSRAAGDDLLPDEDELPDMEAHHMDLTSGEDDVGEGELTLAAPVASRNKAKPKPKLDPKNPETWGKVGRNDACPCGSGKRYKHCHGAYV